MGVIWAQLIIKDVKYGPHPFLVPLRNKKTMKNYDGVFIGDCGLKNGMNIIDNGYISFKNYRIKKEMALDKLSGVDG